MIRAHSLCGPRLHLPLWSARLWSALVFAAAFAAAPAHAEMVRQHSPHVHGRGALNIVLDGRELTAELSAPADDLIGFEHPPHGEAEKSAVRSVVEMLDDAARILGLPAAAACVQDDADIDSPLLEAGHGHDEEIGHHEGGHHEELAHGGMDESADESMGHEEHEGHEEHAEFRVTYHLTCAEPEALGQLTVGYFEDFARAQALAVQAVGPWGQTAATLTREKPSLVLAATH